MGGKDSQSWARDVRSRTYEVSVLAGWEVLVKGADIAMSVSWAALTVSAALAIWGVSCCVGGLVGGQIVSPREGGGRGAIPSDAVW
jgi:hypothetical protein